MYVVVTLSSLCIFFFIFCFQQEEKVFVVARHLVVVEGMDLPKYRETLKRLRRYLGE
jgi:hypothetical protein